MIGVSKFIGQVRTIASRSISYKTGGIGKDGTCDCIGLIMGAMYELGHKKYDMHSTNYFARYQTMEMVTLKSSTEIYPGMILYKARDDQDRINGRYLPGGRYYTGDVLDYYHVGVVTRAKPLEIIECTEYGNVTGIVTSANIKGWEYGGKLRGVDYAATSEEEREDETMVLYKAMVNTREDPLTLRNAPINGKKIGELPRGIVVEVMSTGDWPRVRYGDMMGYASASYLERIEETEAEAEALEVAHTTLIKDDGTVITLEGVWRVAED